MRVLVIVVIVTWGSKSNSSSTCTELQTGTELGNIDTDTPFIPKSIHEHKLNSSITFNKQRERDLF